MAETAKKEGSQDRRKPGLGAEETLSTIPAFGYKPRLDVMSEIPKAYEPKAVEEKWYQFWLNQKCFVADPARAETILTTDGHR